MRRYIFLGLPVDSVTKKEALDSIDAFIKSGRSHIITPTSAAKIVMAYSSKAVRRVLVSSDLIIADGKGVFWGAKLFGINLAEQIPGIDFMEDILRHASGKKYKVYFLGSSSAVVEKTAHIYTSRYPGLNVAGCHNGYFNQKESDMVLSKISSAAPDIVFIGISSPKKEELIERFSNETKVPVWISVGGAFDITAGKYKRAPRLMYNLWLEWLFRLLQEPRRLWKKHFKIGVVFFYLLFKYRFLNFSATGRKR